MQSASRVFKGLAYKRFHHVPLYLEYAPEDVLDEVQSETKERKAASPGPQQTAPTPQAGATAALLDEVDDVANTSTTLYIKNISFVTKRATLEERCTTAATAAGGFLRSLNMPKKKGASGKELLQGYAFAEFSDPNTARAARQRLNGSDLDGHKLLVEISRKETSSGNQGPLVCCSYPLWHASASHWCVLAGNSQVLRFVPRATVILANQTHSYRREAETVLTPS